MHKEPKCSQRHSKLNVSHSDSNVAEQHCNIYILVQFNIIIQVLYIIYTCRYSTDKEIQIKILHWGYFSL